ncbi:MAG TPA: hypothetical protein VGS99_04610 [Gammaproteobacteria bacterium]|nr:hypothetical protein [Gammaproteobacteria bacterium]
MADISVISEYITAAAGLGAASFTLVDGSKAFGGGVSNCGFHHVRRVVGHFAAGLNGPIGEQDMLDTLRANWLNGTPLAGQKAIAKSLIKLRLDGNSAAAYARATGVDPKLLAGVAKKIAESKEFTPGERETNGRFDAVLTALLDEGYQRADQVYRNSAKAWSTAVAIALALLGCWILKDGAPSLEEFAAAFLVGLAATPVAPIAKDLTSALQAGVKVAQLIRK